MKKMIKALLVTGWTALAAHFGMKAYKRVSGVAKLAKSLPEFLNNVYGERPKLNINRSFNTIAIKIGFSQEIIDKHNDIETTVREYVDDFYPDLSKCSVDVSIYVPGVEEEDVEEEPGETSQDDGEA